MKNERIQELLVYYITSKKATESFLNYDLSDDKKKTAQMAIQIFSDTIDVLKIALEKNQINITENKDGDGSGEYTK